MDDPYSVCVAFRATVMATHTFVTKFVFTVIGNLTNFRFNAEIYLGLFSSRGMNYTTPVRKLFDGSNLLPELIQVEFFSCSSK